uniref:Uncharacterized protein n=1 Tax=Onchocerca volvulus TaxID=6282 RepID=A0A8R1TN14_ONCVO
MTNISDIADQFREALCLELMLNMKAIKAKNNQSVNRISDFVPCERLCRKKGARDELRKLVKQFWNR